MKKLFLLMTVLAASCALALGQVRTVRGVVKSAEDGAPLPQLTVLLKGTTTGVVTNLDGEYTIKVPNDAAVLLFKYTGFETQEIAVNGQSVINVSMKPALEEIDQVIVMGYGTGKKVGSTVGRVATVADTDLKERPTVNVMDALQGKVAGMQILTSSGEPSATSSIRIHGWGSMAASTDPLYVLDGMPVSESTIQSVNSSDIENVAVLTDASATSIYGARAANGVIYVTTKQGKPGKGQVVVEGMYGMSNLIASAKDYFDEAMGSEEVLALKKDLNLITQPTIDSIYMLYGKGTNTKWYEYLYRKNAPTWQANVSISGGNNSTQYFMSGGYFTSQGLRAFSNYKRYHLRTNLKSKVNSWLTAGINSNVAYVISNQNAAQNNSKTGHVYNLAPYYTPYDKNGNLYEGLIPGLGIYLPHYMEKNEINNRGNLRYATQLFLQVTPIKGLTIRSQASAEGYYYSNKYNSLPSYAANKQKDGSQIGNSSVSFERDANFTITNTAEYKFSLMDMHDFTVLAGQEYVYGHYNDHSASASGFTDDRLMDMKGGTQNKSISSSMGAYGLNSYFARLEYGLMNRYFFDASLRYDWCSRFAVGHQSGIFWSAGAMWKAKRESFLEDVQWLDDLTVRANVGTSGNSSIGKNYAPLALVATYSIPYRGANSYYVSSPGNPNLTWERQTATTIGVDFSIFRRLSVEASFYYRLTTDLLMDVPNPKSTGFGEVTRNTGAISNMGVDLRFDVNAWSNSKGDYVRPYVTFNYNRERVERLFNDMKMWAPSGYGFAYMVGQPQVHYWPIFYQINPDNGMPEWYKPSGEENATKPHMDSKDITDTYAYEALAQVTGKPIRGPITGGFGLNASYWGFYTQLDFTFVVGKWMYSNDDYFFLDVLGFPNATYSKRYPKNAWKQKGDKGKLYPKMDGKTPVLQWDTRLLSDASFMRLKNFTIGYMVPKRWIEKTKFFNSAKVYMTMRNYLTVTKYKGPDPEVDSNLALGRNPNTKQISFGVELTF